jgi:hypothetical protein
MKKTLIIISFFISIFTFAQIEKLSGKWILEKVLYKDGNNCIKSFVIKKKKGCSAGQLLMFLTYSL